ncbi:hypothetical protein C8Q80DRAFT_342630 [Daedaleopsis nitida]|nr:hypothetical protein C8Q80DRAFT_342630 [Daedaleopsis nitida]
MTEDERADIIANSIARLTSNYCANAGSVLVIYEYIITFARETELFWRGRLTGAAALFYFNRYLNLFNNVYGLVQNLPIPEKVCPSVAISGKILGVLQYVPWAIFSGLRAFALTRNILLSTFIFLLSCVPVGVNYAHFHFNFTGVNNPMAGCLTSDDVTAELSKNDNRVPVVPDDSGHPPRLRHLVQHVPQSGSGASDGEEPLHDRASSRRDDLLCSSRFTEHVASNASHAIEYSTGNVTFVTQFSDPLTTILVSRFLLHLQAVNRRVIHLDSPDGTGMMTTSSQSDADGYGHGHSDIGTLVFERVIGSLAEPLDLTTYRYKDAFDFDFDEEGEEEESTKERTLEKGKMTMTVAMTMRDVEDGVGRGESMEMSPDTASSPHNAVGGSVA